MSTVLLLFICLTYLCFDTAAEVTCRDEGNRPVDWYLGIKIPRMKEEVDPFLSSGTAMVYLTSNDENTWKLSKRSVNDSTNIIANTLQVIYGKHNNVAFVAYNDEFPNGTTSFDNGHSKGVVAFDEKSGFWLVHSVPKFPPLNGQAYSYPHTGTRFGQSFICISFPADQAAAIGTQLQYNEALVYDYFIPDGLRSMYSTLLDAALMKWKNSPPYSSKKVLRSSGGNYFFSFAKGSKFGKDIYSDWIAPTFKINMASETWQNGANKMASECDHQYKVENIKEVMAPVINKTFHSTMDHSKWAISTTAVHGWSCIGDINRMDHQMSRGGGMVCFQNSKVYEHYRKLPTKYEDCPDHIMG